MEITRSFGTPYDDQNDDQGLPAVSNKFAPSPVLESWNYGPLRVIR